jgi:O-antigen ligase
MRSALPFALLAITWAFLIIRLGWRWLGWFILPLIPFLSVIPLVLGVMADSGIINADWLVRKGDAEALTLNGRTIIWAIVFQHFMDFKLQHLWDYGSLGHTAGGISSEVATTPVFSNYTDAESISTHNSYIQVLVDTGYIGLLLYLSLMVYLYRNIIALKHSGRASNEVATGLMFVFLLTAIGGNTETPNQTAGLLFSIFIFLWMYFF